MTKIQSSKQCDWYKFWILIFEFEIYLESGALNLWFNFSA
jgi:hypothetical protein